MEEIIKKIVESISAGVMEKISESLAQPKPSNTELAEDEVFCITDVCKRLKISKATLTRHIKQGLLTPTFYVGRSPRFTQKTIEDYLRMFNS